MTDNPFLIDARALEAHLGRPGLAVVDASWYLPAQKRFARPEYEAGHIPGAVFFDQDAVVDPSSDLPHALPSAERFGEMAGALGLSDRDTIVVYDGMGLFSAARVWWLLRLFGARDVRILAGGLPAWREAGFALETGAFEPAPSSFQARLDEAQVVRLEEMREIVAAGDTQIADARSVERFRGDAAEPRAGVRGGHMPGARSLPFTDLVEAGRLKDEEGLREAFREAGVDPSAPVVTSCGSGVTAAVINLALASLGHAPGRLYDGSWTEWGSQDDTAIETGPARA